MNAIFSNSMMWFLQVALSLLFALRGILKILLSKDEFDEAAAWTKDYSSSVVKVIGMIEILGGIGLVLPFFLGLFFFIVPLAALDLAMISAFTLFAYRRVIQAGEQKDGLSSTRIRMLRNGLYLIAALYIAIGRIWQMGWLG
jgi:uncharacterized membrane protein